MGDGWLVSFASVVAAATCAIQVQERLAGHDRIKLRIGVHFGDIVHEDEDIYGDGVNIASRLQEAAAPGGVMISGTAYESLVGRLDSKFEDAGEQSLKNIARPVRAWRWSSGTQPSTEEPAAPSPNVGSKSARPSIAVLPFTSLPFTSLPFTSLSSDPEQEFFADGMVEDIIDALSKFRLLFVIARGTMFSYKGQSPSVSSVASVLGVRFVLEGSVRQAAGRIRVSAQLIDAESGTTIWSQRYDRQLDDIFAIQDELTQAIAGAIAPEIELSEIERANRVPPSDIDAWLLYQKALSGEASGGREGYEAALAYCEQIQVLDPNFARAYGTRALLRAMLAQNDRPDEYDALLATATDEIRMALKLHPRDADIRGVAARVYFGLADLEQAKVHGQAAVDLNPNSAYAYFSLGMAQTLSGEPVQGIEAIDQAIRISPFDPLMRRFLLMRAIACFQLDQYGEAVAAMERSNSVGFNNDFSFAMTAVAYSRLGRADDAANLIQGLLERRPNFSIALARNSVRRLPAAWLERLIDGLRELGVQEE
jgi:adenylate cyclase